VTDREHTDRRRIVNRLASWQRLVHHVPVMQRDYQQAARRLAPAPDRREAMQTVITTLWDALRDTGVSWVGFYLYEPNDTLVLGPREPKPACSPIGLHGACGQAFTRREPLVVRDVEDLGDHYVACDPRDRSEVVVPCLNPDGTCWGVLDLDSFDIGSFDSTDVAGLQQVLRAAGLTA
jgi:putative methionine-R-sulfoxide reductase with GAF domain